MAISCGRPRMRRFEIWISKSETISNGMSVRKPKKPRIPHSMILSNARLVLPDRIARDPVRVNEGRIAAVSDQPISAEPGEAVIDLAGQFLAPGFIDMHIHGAQRRDTMDATSEAFETICRYHARGGTTALALTTCTAPSEDV